MNILIIKTGAMGDVVRTSFIAQALKEKYKNQAPRIFWITDRNAIPLFHNSPYITHVLSSEKKDKLKKIEFDLTINLEEDEENAKFVSELKPKKIIGAYYKNGKIDYTQESEHWFNMSRISKFGKEKADSLKKQNQKTHRQLISEIININPEKYEPFLRLTLEQRKIADNFLRVHRLARTDLIVGINTGSGERWPKDLSVKKTADLINKIYEKYKARILLFGGPNEVERNKEIHKLSKAPMIDTGTGNNLIEFPALTSVCNLFITSDTLGLHVALALKRKAIALIGPTSHHEVDMYDLGEKIIPDSNCLCCYKEDCKSMQKIKVDAIMKSVDKLLSQKITLVITAFKEPKTISRAIEAALIQKTKYNYEVLVSAPDKETLEVAEKYAINDNRLKIFKDPGKGKMHALNLLFEEVDSDILILTDGDVWISENAVEEIVNLFLDPEIGCVSGRPVPVEKKQDMFGYWANFLFGSAHKLRKNAFERHDFLECSGYLFAHRQNKEVKIPLDTAEDAVIPYYFWEKGFRIGYAEKAEVYVRNVNNWRDWIKQKVRTSKAHETLEKYVDTKTTPRVKSFKTEFNGFYDLFKYASGSRELSWSALLAFARLYMWLLVFYNARIKKFKSVDNWEKIESAR